MGSRASRYRQGQRGLKAGVFEAVVQDPRRSLRELAVRAAGRGRGIRLEVVQLRTAMRDFIPLPRR